MFRPTLDDLRRALPTVARADLVATATSGRPEVHDHRVATYPTRLALTALACADAVVASAVRAGVGGERVLDLACGPAVVSRLLAEAGAAEVVAVDREPRMLDAARAVADLAPASAAPVRWEQADATDRLPLADDSVDVVWIGDFWSTAALPEVRRVLRPGGRAVLRLTRAFDWLPTHGAAESGFAERIGRAVDAGVAAWVAGRDVWQEPVPAGEVAGWELLDSWPEEHVWSDPLPELVEEYVLQDFACFHGHFAARHADPQDWARLRELADPVAFGYALSGPHARVRLAFEYQVYRPGPAAGGVSDDGR